MKKQTIEEWLASGNAITRCPADKRGAEPLVIVQPRAGIRFLASYACRPDGEPMGDGAHHVEVPTTG